MATVDITTLSDDDLMDAWTAAGEEVVLAKANAKRFSDEFNDREEKKRAQAQYDALSDGERAALAQVFEVQGIESQESVSTGEDEDVTDNG